MNETLTSYQPLVDALKVPLPEKIEQRELLRQMVAFAESYGIVVSMHRRTLLSNLEIETANKLEQLREGYHYDSDGQWVASEEQREKFKKANADEKKILLTAEISGLAAELDFVTNLENLIKRRCSLGQSISNSFNTETSSQYNQ